MPPKKGKKAKKLVVNATEEAVAKSLLKKIGVNEELEGEDSNPDSQRQSLASA